MLDANIKTQLKAYLEKLQKPIELVASLDDSATAQEMRGMLVDIAGLSDKVSLREDGTSELRPSFAIGRPGDPALLPADRQPLEKPNPRKKIAEIAFSGAFPVDA